MARSDRSPTTSGDDAEEWREYLSSRDRRLRNVIVERHLGLAHHIARRFGGTGDDDLHQVAMLALVRAVERFDPERAVSFSTFAGATIEGAIKQHRERVGWPVGVPRRLRRIALDVGSARAELEQRLGRSPTVGELAARLGASVDEVLEALAAARTRASSGVDHLDSAPAPGGGDALDDPTSRVAIDRTEIDALLATLTDTERRVFELRFVDQLLQDQIADVVGVSQMQVSRIIRRCVAALQERTSIADGS
ncbi:sigma-70 family RNA polymerase sigma factor [Desertimonas flava]|uniref:sigma-70 family RNA polymerase sigma factor n=1 Tax=Desertimonas flava TaxID=2064846 RepID=UPI0013C53430|nr:sigma-70 family RNA polymerase sigma factor [Desertimonas flava]